MHQGSHAAALHHTISTSGKSWQHAWSSGHHMTPIDCTLRTLPTARQSQVSWSPDVAHRHVKRIGRVSLGTVEACCARGPGYRSFCLFRTSLTLLNGVGFAVIIPRT